MVPACALKSQGDRMLLISGMNTDFLILPCIQQSGRGV